MVILIYCIVLFVVLFFCNLCVVNLFVSSENREITFYAIKHSLKYKIKYS